MTTGSTSDDSPASPDPTTTSSTSNSSATSPEPATPGNTSDDSATSPAPVATGNTSNNSTTSPDPATPGNTGNDPAASPEPGSQPPARWRIRLNSATALAYAVAIVGAVAAAFVTPLGDHVVKAFLDEPTCPGEACEGKNPQIQGCAEDARTFKPAVGNPALLQLRHSEDCQAVWARIERGSPGDLVTVEVTGGAKRTAEIEYGDDKFTSMVRVSDGEFQVTACAVPRAGGESTYERYCIHATEATAWR